jgi:hypothetical protein
MTKKIPPGDPGILLRAFPQCRYLLGGAPVSIKERVLIEDVLISIGEKKSGVDGRFPPIPSLLLPPNNKETVKPEAFASSCFHPCSYYCCV